MLEWFKYIYFSKVTIPSLYVRTRETVTSELQGVEYFAATADMWSSNTLEPYIMEYGSTPYVGMARFLNGRHIKSA